MTVQEIKDARRELEKELNLIISDKIKAFEEKSGVQVSEVYIGIVYAKLGTGVVFDKSVQTSIEIKNPYDN